MLVGIGVSVGEAVSVGVAVSVGIGVGVSVGVGVDVAVRVNVGVGLGVSVGWRISARTAGKDMGAFDPRKKASTGEAFPGQNAQAATRQTAISIRTRNDHRYFVRPFFGADLGSAGAATA